MEISHIHLMGTELNELEVVEKEWGEEHIICRQPHAAKIMKLKPGYQVSMHWHGEKSETFILISGGLTLELLDSAGHKEILDLTEPFSSITINRMTPHTFYCPDEQEEETIFIEASTTDHPDDNYRLFPSGPRSQSANSRGLTNR